MSGQISPQELAAVLGIPFTSEQLAAITAPAAPAVVVAGAGSGKTAVMTARVVWLVAGGEVLPDEVLGLTFTNKAAAELAQRVRRALAKLGRSGTEVADGEPTISTYHAYAASLLREYGLRGGYEPSARLLADAARYQLAERVVRRAPGPFLTLRLQVPALTKAVVALEGELNEHLVDPAQVVEHDEALLSELAAVELERGSLTARPTTARIAARGRAELLALVMEYRQAKSSADAVDFGDQMAGAAGIAKAFPEIGTAERQRFRAVLLDEYQDTSIAQKQLLLALYGPGYPVMAVGDPLQAIYGWRGASVRNIGSFAEDFGAVGRPAAQFPLSRNNRSDERVLELANVVAAPLLDIHPTARPLQPRQDKVDAGDVTVRLHIDRDAELAALGDEISSRLASGTPPRDVAVLCRDSSGFAALHEALTVRSVPVEVVGLGGLLELPEIVDLVAILRVLDDPGANPALLRVLTGPRWRIGPRDIALLGRRASDLVTRPPRSEVGSLTRALADAVAGIDPAEVVSLSEALHDPGPGDYSQEARRRFRSLDRELNELRDLRAESLLDLVQRILDVTGLAVETSLVSLRSGAHHAPQLAAFLTHVSAFADLDGSASLGAFLAFISASVDYEGGLDAAVPSDANSVKVMTIHKAKGLEWPLVYLPMLCQRVFPSTRGRSLWTGSAQVLPYALRGDAADFPVVQDWAGNTAWQRFHGQMRQKDQLEERRLAYVGFTRAEHEVVLSGHWWGPTQSRRRGPSEFLLSAREYCLAGGGCVQTWAPEPPDDATNPALDRQAGVRWPPEFDRANEDARAEGARLVLAALDAPRERRPKAQQAVVDADRIHGWDADLDSLLAEAAELHAPNRSVRLPRSLSASSLIRLARDPSELARNLARPMPRRPAPAARRGTRFHQWVESRFGQPALIDLDDLDSGDVDDQADLGELQQAFLAGPYADRVPLAVEAPFQIVLAGQVISGRIDAVYRAAGDRNFVDQRQFEIVDWKTGTSAADALQLAIYRLAWAELQRVPLENVHACFYYVARGLVEPAEELPDRDQLSAILTNDVVV